jgi:hypothetical protein
MGTEVVIERRSSEQQTSFHFDDKMMEYLIENQIPFSIISDNADQTVYSFNDSNSAILFKLKFGGEND